MDSNRLLTHSLQDQRVARILAAALEAVEPGAIVRRFLSDVPLPPHKRLFLLGIGKAAEAMVAAAAEMLPGYSSALMITKRAVMPPLPRATVIEAAHPLPDARSVVAGRAALDLVSKLSEYDLLVCLVSGGGSALATAPRKGIGLRDIQTVTNALLAAGARIDEINTLRRHLDSIKGGGLARHTRANVLTLLLSDVVGDHLEAIASGPTAPDPTSGTDALAVLDKYEITVPANVYTLLSAGASTDRAVFARVRNVIVGNNEVALQAALARAEAEGFESEILQRDVQGEARVIGEQFAAKLRDISEKGARPRCLICGGETTVTLRGNGKGGRNQELALAAVDPMAGLRDVLLVALATDGDDGPTDAAGAVVTGTTQTRGRTLHMLASHYLEQNNAYSYFESLGDLLKPGYTGSNVNDVILLVAL